MIQIDELVIRVPGFSEQQARQLGNDVAGRVAAGLQDGPMGGEPVSELHIRIPSAAHNSEEVAGTIAESILTQLRLATR